MICIKYKPKLILDFNINKPEVDSPYDNHRNIFGPTPTAETEIFPGLNIQAHTKIGRFPPRTNSLLNVDKNERYNIHKDEIEQFCTTGFDCGNGVCLSSVKVKNPNALKRSCTNCICNSKIQLLF